MVSKLNAAFYAKAGRELARVFDGGCRVYHLALGPLGPDGVCQRGGLGEQRDSSGDAWPCHLAFLQQPPAGLTVDGCPVEARCRLFWPPELPELPPGSRLQVEQQGRVYDLVCSGLPVRYPTHWETELRLLPKRA